MSAHNAKPITAPDGKAYPSHRAYAMARGVSAMSVCLMVRQDRWELKKCGRPPRAIIHTNLETGDQVRFESAEAAAKELYYVPCIIRRWAKAGKTRNGVKWEYEKAVKDGREQEPD
jgi:hypothetical protein